LLGASILSQIDISNHLSASFLLHHKSILQNHTFTNHQIV
jgi:hypothetical protein